VADHPISDRAVLYEPPIIRYRIDGKIAEEHPLSALRRVIHMYAGTDLDATDIEFDLLDFGESIWIVPYDISLETHMQWAEHLRKVEGYFEASIAWPPKRWLDGGFLGLLRRPAARILRGEALPPDDSTWEMKGPLDPVTYKPFARPGTST
jgi:hypothetical protein